MNTNNDTNHFIDGVPLVIRKPDAEKDLENLVQFFSALPRRVSQYLRYDVTDINLCKKRFEQIDELNHWRLLAELDGKIVGEGALDREPFGWTRHVAQLRSVMDIRYQGRGIDAILLGELIERGTKAGIERIYSEVLKEQLDAISRLEQEGFAYECTRKNYAKDRKGKLHDVVIMSNDSSVLWRKLADQMEELDIQLPRIHGGA